jgi:hypothetical protein
MRPCVMCRNLLVGLAIATLGCGLARQGEKPEFEKLTGDPIPGRGGEVVLWTAPGHPASAVLLGVALPPETVARDVHRRFLDRWGLIDERRRPRFGASVASFDSRPFNETTGSYSVLHAEVLPLDGSGSCAVVVLQREDRWRSWAKEFHTGLRLPFRVWSNASLVTQGEVDVFSAPYADRGVFTTVVLPADWLRPLADLEAVRRGLGLDSEQVTGSGLEFLLCAPTSRRIPRWRGHCVSSSPARSGT